jgi:hypothetical protein
MLIGNTLKTFLEVDWSFLAIDEYVVPRILVSDQLKGRSGGGYRTSSERKILQEKTGLQGVSFRCIRCHKQGHVVSSMPSSFQT